MLALCRHILALALVLVAGAAHAATEACPALLDHLFPRLQDDAPQSLCQYKGKVVLVVNTRITNKKEKQAKMSLICKDRSSIAQFTPQISNDVFRTMNRYLPGPYTFILRSNNYVQKFFKKIAKK